MHKILRKIARKKLLRPCGAINNNIINAVLVQQANNLLTTMSQRKRYPEVEITRIKIFAIVRKKNY